MNSRWQSQSRDLRRLCGEIPRFDGILDLVMNMSFEGVSLVVDDDDDLREILVEMLIEFGLKVDEASSGEEGLMRLRQKPYDYVMSDMKMFGMSGIEFLKEARKINLCGDAKYLLISGSAIVMGNQSPAELGADEILSKPFFREDVCKILLDVNHRIKKRIA